MTETRDNSFWKNKISFLDSFIQNMRINKIKKILDFNDKVIVDTWCWFNAAFLSLISKNFSAKKLIAVDLKLNPDLEKYWIETIECNLNKEIKLEDSSADIIISMAILEHLEEPEIYLDNIFRILKKDWLLLMTVPSIYSKPVLEFMALNLWIISKEEILDHKKYYNKDLLIDILTKTWFKKENIKHKYFQLFMNNIVIAKKND